jgi:predicted deacylase
LPGNTANPLAIEIEPRDIGPFRRGNTGIDYVTTFDSGKAGPHVMVTALTHGNELSGAHAVGFLFDHAVRPRRGRLTLCFANVAAYLTFDPDSPFESRFFDEDFNRVWDEATLDGPRDSVELERARAIRPLVDTVDMLLDLHSTSLLMAPMILCGMRDKGLALARGIGSPAHVVIDAGHASGKRLRDYAPFDDPAIGAAAALVECGQHFERAANDVAIDTTLRFLRHCDIVDPDFIAQHVSVAATPQMVIRVSQAVTIETDRFTFTHDLAGFEVIAEADTLIGHDGDREVRTPYDNCVMVMPVRDLKKGLTAVRLGEIVD